MSWWQPNNSWQNHWHDGQWYNDQWSRDHWNTASGRWVWQDDHGDQQQQEPPLQEDEGGHQDGWRHQPDENYEWSYGRTGGESQQSTWSGYGYWEGEWGHSSGIPRTSSGREETASDSAGRGAVGEEYGTEASNHGSGSNDRKKPVTGKEVVPSYNGESALREYRRRVDLFLATTGIDEEFRAGRLMEKLEGRAWQATQTLQVSRLRSSEGVQCLLDHLQKELEPVEHLQIFNTLHEFFRGFKRSRGEEFSTYDTRFRAQLQKMEEIGAPLDGLVRSYWFLEGSGISAELRKQVISAAGGSYNYEKLWAALVAIVPTVKRDESEIHGRAGNGAGEKPKFERRGHKPHGVHAVEEDGDGAEEHHGEEEGINGEIDDEEALAMEQEAQVLLTQAAKRRSMAERGRGYQRVESTEERESRIKHMKTKMACSACRAHGKTTFGHWHADKACPYYEESMALKKKKEGEKSNKVFVVQGDEDEEEEDTDSDQPAYEVMITWSGMNQQSGLAMTDTCCARTVVGEEWAEKHMESMWKQGVEFLVVNEQQPFRFGPGRRIYSTFALIFPMAIQDEKKIAVVRASVVPQKVPLLLSKRVLADLGATMFLRKECIEFEELGTTTKLITTDNDQVAIKIDDYQERHRKISNEVLLDVLRDDEEVSILKHSRTGNGSEDGKDSCTLENPQEPAKISKDRHVHLTKSSPNSVPGSISKCAARQRHRGLKQNVRPKVEGRVCGGDQQALQCEQGGAEEARSPTAEGDLDGGEAQQANPCAASGMEAGQLGHTERDVPRLGGGRFGSSKRRQALGWMEEEPILAGDRPVEPRHRGDSQDMSTRVHPAESNLSHLRYQHGTQDQQVDEGGLLGLPPIPVVSGDAVPDIQRTASGGHAEQVEGREGGDQSRESGQEGGLWRRSQEIIGTFGAKLSLRQWFMGDGRLGDGRQHRPHEHEPDHGGDEDDHAEPRGQGGLDQNPRRDLSPGTSWKRGSERVAGNSESEPLSRDEIQNPAGE